MIKGQGMQEAKALRAPPQLVKDIVVAFGNFFRIQGNSEHDWASCLTVPKDALLEHLRTFNYDAVSKGQVLYILSLELETNESVRCKSSSVIGINTLLHCAQNYYRVKASIFSEE